MLFLFRSAPEVEKRIHSKLFRKFWRSRGTKEPAYITVVMWYYSVKVDLVRLFFIASALVHFLMGDLDGSCTKFIGNSRVVQDSN